MQKVQELLPSPLVQAHYESLLRTVLKKAEISRYKLSDAQIQLLHIKYSNNIKQSIEDVFDIYKDISIKTHSPLVQEKDLHQKIWLPWQK